MKNYENITLTADNSKSYNYNNSLVLQENNKIHKQGPIFTINTPVKEGDTFIEGTGPSGVPIVLIDISEMGKILGETTIDNTGNYKFYLNEPLIFGHGIGLIIGDLTNTNYHYEDFIYSDNYTDMPLIGIILTKTSVVHK